MVFSSLKAFGERISTFFQSKLTSRDSPLFWRIGLKTMASSESRTGFEAVSNFNSRGALLILIGVSVSSIYVYTMLLIKLSDSSLIMLII